MIYFVNRYVMTCNTCGSYLKDNTVEVGARSEACLQRIAEKKGWEVVSKEEAYCRVHALLRKEEKNLAGTR